MGERDRGSKGSRKRRGRERRKERRGGRKSKKGNLKTSSKTIRAGNFWRITNLSIIDCKIFILVNNDNTLVSISTIISVLLNTFINIKLITQVK